MGTSYPPPPPQRPDDFQTRSGYPHDPDLEPATAGDVRTLRRWVTVAGVWAVAASLIALIALFGGGGGDSNSPDGVDAGRLADLSKQIDQARAESRDAVDVANRATRAVADMEAGTESDSGEQAAGLADAQRVAEDTTASVDELSDQVDELEQRIELLEEEASPIDGTGSDDGL